MRTLIFALILLLPTVGRADDWTPPENPDPNLILREAKKDASRGDYELALAKQLWYHENAVKLNPSQSGIRRSFALSYWLELGENYPPALEKMRQIRDETKHKIRDPNRVRVRFHDFKALNKTFKALYKHCVKKNEPQNYSNGSVKPNHRTPGECMVSRSQP